MPALQVLPKAASRAVFNRSPPTFSKNPDPGVGSRVARLDIVYSELIQPLDNFKLVIHRKGNTLCWALSRRVESYITTFFSV